MKGGHIWAHQRGLGEAHRPLVTQLAPILAPFCHLPSSTLPQGNGSPLQWDSGESRGQRSLEGYGLWGCKESGHDLATEQQRPFPRVSW